MRINILASHRFHLLDLARELSSLGHDVRFYSYVSKKRCASFGMIPSRCKSLMWLVWPFFILQKLVPRRFNDSVIWYRNLLMDWYLAEFMRQCDVCIGLGSVYLRAFESAKQRGATTILEWGSKHTIEQHKHFGEIDIQSNRNVRRELRGYDVCDYIAIAADHVRQSFIKQGVPDTKLLVNPYGVDLKHFRPTMCSKEYDLIMVGGWRFEKGCDLIIELLKKKNYSFLHVGPLVNMDFPNLTNMTHHDPVDQKELIDYYRKARVFILPSRAEGLAMVQAQAIACGLPVVCSKETGGRDLREQLLDKKWIIEMAELTVDSLDMAVVDALALTQDQQGIRDYAGECINNLTWEAYGSRYSKKLFEIKNV